LDKDLFKQAAEAISKADALLITAGAGMGVDSGLPDFRGNEGFWKAYPPIAKRGIPFYEMANPKWFESDPGIGWAFYGHRLNLYRNTIPHSGFKQLLEIGSQKNAGYFVFTSNVDGQFQQAGFAEDKIQECHGSIHHLQCSRPCSNQIWSARDTHINIDEVNFEAKAPFPICNSCGIIARPNILMFGDWAWVSARTGNQDRQFNLWLNLLNTKERRIAIIEIGAGTAVPTVRHLSESIARQFNGTLIRINPQDAHVPEGHISICCNAAGAINKIFDLVL
jgi:NAD-dependent SIR2 family protein deacetylase